MQVGIHEEQSLDLELLAKSFGKASISISHDHDFDALISPRSYRVAQLRNLFTTEKSTEVPQEDENDGLVLPQIAQADRAFRCRIDQRDRRETGRTTQVNLLSGGALKILA
jgi:hypothetical protein